MDEQYISIDTRGVMTIEGGGRRIVLAPTQYKLTVDFDPAGGLRVEVNARHPEWGNLRVEARAGDNHFRLSM